MKEEKDESQKETSFFERRGWKTSMGFYLAVMCSSFGLINIWRFPHIVIQNGGGAFLYVYFFLAAIVGSCFIMGELLIGKMAQQSLWVSLDRWTKDRIALNPKISIFKKMAYRALQRLSETSILAGLLVGAYYTVISAWVLNYLVNFILAMIFPSYFTARITDASEDSFWLQFLFAGIHLALCYFFVRRGIHRWLVRSAYIIALIFGLMLLMLCFQSLTLPNAADAIRFLLYPDFTQVTYASLNQALGHMVLSLGLGLGIMSTFGGYFKSNRDITSSGSKIMTCSIIMSGLSVVMICPMVLGAPYAVFGPKLLFQTLPQLILKFPEGELFLMAFYFILYLASLVVSAGILESLVSNLSERLSWSFSKTLNCIASILPVLIIFPILSTTLWRHFRWLEGVSLLETADGILVNYILPIAALGLALSALYILPAKLVKREFIGPEIDQEISQFFPIWRAVILWLAPLIILISFLLRMIDP